MGATASSSTPAHAALGVVEWLRFERGTSPKINIGSAAFPPQRRPSRWVKPSDLKEALGQVDPQRGRPLHNPDVVTTDR